MNEVYYTILENEFRCSGQSLLKISSHNCSNDITYMDLSHNQISSFEGLGKYKSLQTLILDSNLIGDVIDIPCCPSLTTLSLNKNKITDLDQFLDLLRCSAPSLRYLSLLGNQACPHQLLGLDYDDNDYRRYRCYVIHCLPHLKFLDSTAVTKQEREEADLRGQYFKIIKPTFDISVDIIKNDCGAFIPLPPSKSNLAPQRSIYGACRYRYTGKNSEGNRFIRNNDL